MEECDSRRERKKSETRQRLLDAAWRLFQEQGYDHTTVAQITEAADVGKGTFYNHFKSKEHLFFAIDLRAGQILRERFAARQGRGGPRGLNQPGDGSFRD